MSLIGVVYWMLIFEGAIRKWAFPEYHRILFFMRDPIVILIYVLALKDGWGPRKSPFFLLGALFGVLAVPLMVVQYCFDPTRFYWLLAFYGWRNYFLYLPLAFIIARCFEVEDLAKLVRQTLWLAIPIAVLVYFQSVSAPSAPINQGFGDDADSKFSGLALVGKKIRPLGTFTSNQGQSPFVVASFAMVFIAWLTRSIRTRMTTAGLTVATCGVLSCLALSGSRTAVMWAGLVVVAAMVSALLGARRRSPIPVLVAPTILVLIGVVVMPAVFPDAVGAFTARWTEANDYEKARHGSGGVFARALDDFFNFRYIMGEQHLQGYQIGMGGNAANLLGIQNALFPLQSDQQGVALESEWGRHIVDLGILGVVFIMYRMAFVIWICRQAVRATWMTGNPESMLLFGFIGILLLNGQITGQGAQNGFAWLFAGFTLAACKFRGRSRRLETPLQAASVHRIPVRRTLSVEAG